jgi:hypothetical protein
MVNGGYIKEEWIEYKVEGKDYYFYLYYLYV